MALQRRQSGWGYPLPRWPDRAGCFVCRVYGLPIVENELTGRGYDSEEQTRGAKVFALRLLSGTLRLGVNALCEQLVHHASVHIRQPEITALEAECQLLVIESQ